MTDPDFEELIEASSLGTPAAKEIRELGARMLRGEVPYQVTRVWTVMATDPADALDKARPGEHHDFATVQMPCTDWPAPCTHDPQHVRPTD